MNRVAKSIGKWLAIYLSKEIEIKATAPPSNPLHLQATLRPGDILLVEGNTRLSGAIKYLTPIDLVACSTLCGHEFQLRRT